MSDELYARLNACPGVKALGRVENLSDVYEESQIFLAPLFTGDGMRVKNLEALSSGKLLISTGRGMAGNDLPEGKTWLLADSVEEFVDKIQWCFSNPDEVARISELGSRMVRERYHWDVRIKALESIYAKVLLDRRRQ